MKLFKIQALDSENGDHDYVAFIHPQHVIRVDSACPCDRKFRRECNSVVITTTGKLMTNENVVQFVERLESALEAAESSIPDV